MVRKISTPLKERRFDKCMEDVVRKREHNFGNRETRSGWTEQITGEILRRSEQQKRQDYGPNSLRVTEISLVV